jgi:hypothetical protein
MSLSNIFQKPFELKGLGIVYPVKLINWDEFEENVSPIMLSKNHLELTIDQDLPLLDRVVIGLQDDRVINSLCKVFDIVLKSNSFKIIVGNDSYMFMNENDQIVDSTNYDELRRIILHQNILFEPKVYKTPALQKWAEKVLKARGKNAPNVTIEDMLSTVSVMAGKHYWDLEQYTIYQLRYDFNRICKIKNYETQSLIFSNPYADLSNVKLDHFAENVDMYENPYDGVFKENKLTKLNSAIGS